MNNEFIKNPVDFTFDRNTPKVILIASSVYFFGWYIGITSMKNTRTGEEYGSSKWMDPGRLGRMLKEKKKFTRNDWEVILSQTKKCLKERHPVEALKRIIYQMSTENDVPVWQLNMLFSERVKVAIKTKCSNINTLILGGSGKGKSRGFIIPNIMQLNSTFLCTDPKGEILRMTGKLLKMNGYDVRVLDLKNHERSHGYNPFVYFRNDDDVLLFVNNFWSAMEDKAATKGEQIWDEQAKSMLMSFCLFLYHYAPIEEQNFDTVMYLYHQVDISENGGNALLDKLYERIPHEDPAYGYYKDWSIAKGRTLASICSTFSSRMAIFNLESMKSLTYKDEMDLLDLATKKVALFLVLPDSNAVYNFIAGTLYTQVFQQLYDYADNVANGPLPQHVRFYMDEFANIALPNDYQKILSTARSRNMSFVIVLQDKQQIEAIFEKYYKTLYGNCSFLLFLGSKELDTCKYYSELLGKETIHVYTYTKNYGRNSGSSRNEQIVGRELMQPDELQRLDPRKCIVYVDGQNASLDTKTDMTRHKYYRYIADGPNERINEYRWGEDAYSTGRIEILSEYNGLITPLPASDDDWEFLSSEEIEKMIA